ncbi:MAG TPA: hypothetical protein VL527_17055 [Dongiaceae bacterium]|jgi:exopolyphosphatase/guanosine-5'-triphosphate,3'-diphosphate pyrophosphatase|nr:hypothetical protein [Dongiaceae bacterium]
MKSARRAVIDIGTNSVKLLVARVTGWELVPLVEDSRQTRLGQGFYDTHRLRPEAIRRTAEAVAQFARMARKHRPERIRVIATSAARDAKNHRALTRAIHRASGLPVEIISGELEADLAFHGVTTDRRLARTPLLLLDVGGGSTEFVLGQGRRKHFRHSFPLGTVRLLEKLPHSDPPTRREYLACRRWVRAFLKRHVSRRLKAELRREARLAPGRARVRLVGTGGTATVLARLHKKLKSFDRAKIEGVRLSRKQLQAWRERLWRLPLAERLQITGLPKKRGDVILTGVVIYEEIMAGFHFASLQVTTRGLRFAALMDWQAVAPATRTGAQPPSRP